LLQKGYISFANCVLKCFWTKQLIYGVNSFNFGVHTVIFCFGMFLHKIIASVSFPHLVISRCYNFFILEDLLILNPFFFLLWSIGYGVYFAIIDYVGWMGWDKCCLGPSLPSSSYNVPVFPTEVSVSFVFKHIGQV